MYSDDAVYSDAYSDDIASVLVTEEQIRQRTAELAEEVARDFRAKHCHPAPGAAGGEDLLLVGVLKGAVMFMTDFARALPIPV